MHIPCKGVTHTIAFRASVLSHLYVSMYSVSAYATVTPLTPVCITTCIAILYNSIIIIFAFLASYYVRTHDLHANFHVLLLGLAKMFINCPFLTAHVHMNCMHVTVCHMFRPLQTR